MIIKTNYYELLKDKDIMKMVASIINVPGAGIYDKDGVYNYICSLEEKYNQGDMEAGSLLVSAYKLALEGIDETADEDDFDIEKKMLAHHMGEIAMNVYLKSEDFNKE